jgi:hypothetical protein
MSGKQNFIHRNLLVLLALGLLLGTAACNSQAVPRESAVINPSSTATAALPSTSDNTVVPDTTTKPAASPSLTVTPIQPSTSSITPSPKIAEVNISANHLSQDFPNKITFTLEGSCAGSVKNIYLEYGTEKHTVADEVNRVEPPHGNGIDIKAGYVWEMKKTGSIPPGATVWWRWRVIDASGGIFIAPRQTVVWEDSRYTWQIMPSTTMDIYYINQSNNLMKELTSGLETNLARVKLSTDIPKERKPRIYIYNSSDQIRGAVLFAQDWTGAIAYPDYNIILTAVSSSNLDWAKGAIAHEITHLRVREAVFGPFGDLPTWLNEGLAEYAGTTSIEKSRLDAAAKSGNLISISSLSSTFPTDSDQASLAYIESRSLVGYLVENLGWDKMQQLLATFKEGSTFDNAFKKVYSFDQKGLESKWKSSMGAQ